MNRNEKGEDLNQTSQNIKDNFVTRFESMKESNSEIFINKIENNGTSISPFCRK